MIEVLKLGHTADEAFTGTIFDCLQGHFIATEKDSSYEILNYTTGMSNPRARIITNPLRPLNLIVAVARFVWMASGNNRVHDIAYYEPKVAGFSDNGLVVPGSCYGNRLFEARPGCNQIAGVVQRLRDNPGTRRAAAVIWTPEDAVRVSNDIPCAFGVFYHIREGRLSQTTVMRSNNAYRILPFNLFEFSMLQELVAAELDLPLGDYVHWAASMHVYDNMNEMPNTLAISQNLPGESFEMPPMPGGDALAQVNLLAKLEASLRHCWSQTQFDDIVQDSRENLNDYWLNLFNVLAVYTSARRDYMFECHMSDSLVRFVQSALQKMWG